MDFGLDWPCRSFPKPPFALLLGLGVWKAITDENPVLHHHGVQADHHQEGLACPHFLVLHLLVEKLGDPSSWLFWEVSLWRVVWIDLVDMPWAWACFGQGRTFHWWPWRQPWRWHQWWKSDPGPSLCYWRTSGQLPVSSPYLLNNLIQLRFLQSLVAIDGFHRFFYSWTFFQQQQRTPAKSWTGGIKYSGGKEGKRVTDGPVTANQLIGGGGGGKSCWFW